MHAPDQPPAAHEHASPHVDAGHHVDVGSAPAVTPMSGRRLVVLGALGVLVLVVLFVVSVVPRRNTASELRAEAAGRDSAPLVQVVTVGRAPAGSELSLPGTIQALHESAIYARVAGYVKRWNADIGKVVKAGDVLAEIDTPELEQEVQQAQSQLSQTHAALQLARADLDRWKVLARDSAVTGQELDQKKAAFDAATANTGASEANVRRLMRARQYTRVTAPFAGVVTARNVDIGSLITAAGAASASAGTLGAAGSAGAGSMFRIAQTDTVRTYLTVPEAYATSIRPGLAATITVQGIRGRTFTGRVARTSQALDATSRTLLTEVDITNTDRALLPGMFARAVLQFPRVAPPMLLPAAAIVIRSKGTQVVEVEAGKDGTGTVHFRSVQIARDYGSTVELQGGLADGATVVLNPSADLTEGARVRILAKPVSGAAASTP